MRSFLAGWRPMGRAMRMLGLVLGLFLAACGQQTNSDDVTHPVPSSAELDAQVADAPPAGSCIYGPRSEQLIALNGENLVTGSARNQDGTALNPFAIRCTNGQINIVENVNGQERVITQLSHFKFTDQDLRNIPQFQVPDEARACVGFPSGDRSCTTLSNAFEGAYSLPNSETFAVGFNPEGRLIFITVTREEGKKDGFLLFAANLDTGAAQLVKLLMVADVVTPRPLQASTIPKSR